MKVLFKSNVKSVALSALVVSCLSVGFAPCGPARPVGVQVDTEDGTKPLVTPPSVDRPSIELALGASHGCALIKPKGSQTGGVKCWGSNKFGQLGSKGDPDNLLSAVPVQGLDSGVVDIAAGGNTSCAIYLENSLRWLKCWGRIRFGSEEPQEGKFTSDPTMIQGLNGNVHSVTVGKNHVCVLTSQNQVKCFGDNDEERLGRAEKQDKNLPLPVKFTMKMKIEIKEGLSLTRAVPFQAASIIAGENTTCGILAVAAGANASERVLCWGVKIGDNAKLYQPGGRDGLLSGDGNIQQIAVGASHICIVIDGRVQCVGKSDNLQLGTDYPHYSEVAFVPPPDTLHSGVEEIAAGSNFTCARQKDVVSCWGQNNLGQLGSDQVSDPIKKASARPVEVKGLGHNLGQIAASANQACAVVGHQVKCWGALESDTSGSLPQLVQGIE